MHVNEPRRSAPLQSKGVSRDLPTTSANC